MHQPRAAGIIIVAAKAVEGNAARAPAVTAAAAVQTTGAANAVASAAEAEGVGASRGKEVMGVCRRRDRNRSGGAHGQHQRRVDARESLVEACR